MNYTANHRLPQWNESDRIRMSDFNQMNQNLESSLNAAASKADAAQTTAAAAKAAADNAYSPDNKPYVIGSYTGDGDVTQIINLGFRPSFLLVSGMTESDDVNKTDSIVRYFAITADNANVRRRVQLVSIGIAVYEDGNRDQQLPSLNEPGRHYDFIAFR